jgi:hypothetical protein
VKGVGCRVERFRGVGSAFKNLDIEIGDWGLGVESQGLGCGLRVQGSRICGFCRIQGFQV